MGDDADLCRITSSPQTPPCCEITLDTQEHSPLTRQLSYSISLATQNTLFLYLHLPSPYSEIVQTTPHTCLSRQNHFKARAPCGVTVRT